MQSTRIAAPNMIQMVEKMYHRFFFRRSIAYIINRHPDAIVTAAVVVNWNSKLISGAIIIPYSAVTKPARFISCLLYTSDAADD